MELNHIIVQQFFPCFNSKAINKDKNKMKYISPVTIAYSLFLFPLGSRPDIFVTFEVFHDEMS